MRGSQVLRYRPHATRLAFMRHLIPGPTGKRRGPAPLWSPEEQRLTDGTERSHKQRPGHGAGSGDGSRVQYATLVSGGGSTQRRTSRTAAPSKAGGARPPCAAARSSSRSCCPAATFTASCPSSVAPVHLHEFTRRTSLRMLGALQQQLQLTVSWQFLISPLQLPSDAVRLFATLLADVKLAVSWN